MTISVETSNHVTVITFNRPEAKNALSPDMMAGFHRALVNFIGDNDARVAILTGAGEDSFCVGADLKQTFPPKSAFAADYFQQYSPDHSSGVYTRGLSVDVARVNKPLIAAINGFALGGGMEIALGCDLRIGSENASFGLPEVKIASVPALGGLSRLLRAVPSAVAMKLLLTGERLSAIDAHRFGLISDIVSPDRLMDKAWDIASAIVANGPLAVMAIKEVARASQNIPLSESIALEQVMWGILRDTQDRREGREAFGQKRSPRYEGK